MAQVELVYSSEDVPSREQQLYSMGDDYLKCRSSGHWWEETHEWGAVEPGSKGRIQRNWSTWIGDCHRCGAHRTVITTTYHERRSARTEHPDGYLLQGAKPKGGTKREARKELARRSSR